MRLHLLSILACYCCCVSFVLALSSNSSSFDDVEPISVSTSSHLEYDPSVLKNQQLYLGLFHNVPHVEPPPETKAGGGNFAGCGRGSFFFSFSPQCRKAVEKIVQRLQTAQNPRVVIKLARKIRDDPKIHPKAWFTALTIVTLDRSDMRGLWKPPPFKVIPDSFLRTGGVKNRSSQNCVINDETFGVDNGIENRLWYFREDIHVNAQHWYWHIVYPNYLNTAANANVYHADRRAELFYYFHHNIIARYNTERLCNNVQLVAPLGLQHGYILDPFYAHLNDDNTGRQWMDRVPGTLLPESVFVPSGSNQVTPVLLQSELVNRDRLIQGIDNGYLQGAQGQQVPISNFSGIDILLDALESSRWSVNLSYYGSLHNSLHIQIALASDPTNPYAAMAPGVMADTAVSMRDVSFYNWHSYIDDMSARHKRTLPPYQLEKGDFPLLWRSVAIEQVGLTSSKKQANKVETFWSMRNITLLNGLAFENSSSNQPPVKVCVKHLNHDDFTYHIAIATIPDGFPSPLRATVRIFLAPRFGSNGKRFTMEEQRLLFFAMDAFPVKLQPGLNTIKRSSAQSSLTTLWSQELETMQPSAGAVLKNKPYCGCGWPYHMLLPKSTTDGMVFDLFVMVTNGNEDQPSSSSSGGTASGSSHSNYTSECRPAYILCGIPHQKYPDTRPMGYPFDRTSYHVTSYNPFSGTKDRPVSNLDEFVYNLPNAATTQILIRHVDKVVEPKAKKKDT